MLYFGQKLLRVASQFFLATFATEEDFVPLDANLEGLAHKTKFLACDRANGLFQGRNSFWLCELGKSRGHSFEARCWRGSVRGPRR